MLGLPGRTLRHCCATSVQIPYLHNTRLVVVPDRLGYYPYMTQEKKPPAMDLLGRRGGLKDDKIRKVVRVRWAKKRREEAPPAP